MLDFAEKKNLPEGFVPETSRIRQFAAQFEVIGTCEDTEQAEENLRSGTSLAALFQQDHGLFGYACGVRKKANG